ncbi:hypothetical protein ACFYZT_33785 [Streptomyces sp. NPDC001591]|uniref:hypothetical protein n=1 Tax=Streptomyces sp. NPDC001591 TaxID=3364589 RepID=UPI0036C65B99
MLEVSTPAVARGFRLGLAILDRFEITVHPKELEGAVTLAVQVLNEIGVKSDKPVLSPPPDHAIEMFIMNTVLAAGARAANEGEEALSNEDMEKSLGFFGWFFNSFWHFKVK